MIFFLHNTYNRPKQVVEHSVKERLLYPDSYHLIVYNNEDIYIKKELVDMEVFYFGENKGHKTGSLNSVYSALKKITNNFKMTNDDIIFFSHDDIFLSNNNKFFKYVSMMNEYDFIGRRCIQNKHIQNCNHYVMMESFLIKPNVAKLLVENYTYNQFNDNDLLLDTRGSASPEMNFGRDVINKINKQYFIDINENSFGENELGYYHIQNIRGKGE
jgi:hypothetical protein